MLAAQRDYGRDSTDHWSSEGIALGRCLHRILPEDRFDTQPLIGGGGRYVLAADVRLDNRAELAAHLGVDSVAAAGLSDAALLLQLLERREEGALNLINGDFAFALWDGERRRLLLARDPTGQRPLYYHQAAGFFAFASMPKGLHALPDVPRLFDERRITEFIALVPEMGRVSHYRAIDQVPPGHFLTVENGRATSTRYWRPEPRDLGYRRFEDYRDAFREQLDRAVEARLRGAGDCVATHLSSGWDSSSVTATAARLMRERDGRVLAFTSIPRRAGERGAPFNRIADEGDIAAATAALYPNVEHVLVEGAGKSPLADLDRNLELFDRPIYNPCNFVWLNDIRARAADRGVRVLLTGELGNFSISAAPHTVLADLVRQGRWLQWWREARALSRGGNARLRGIAANSFGPWVPDRLWQRLRRFSSRPETEAFAAVHPRLQAEVGAWREAGLAGLARRPKDRFRHALQAIGQYDYGNYRKGTLAGWGIDERDPTADRRLIEFCLSLPVEMLLRGGRRRPLARAALSDRLPREVIDEPRKGYQAADWHEGLSADRKTVQAMVDRIEADADATSMIDVAALRRLLAEWPVEGWDSPLVAARYRSALLGALSAAHFVLSAPAKAAASDPAANGLAQPS